MHYIDAVRWYRAALQRDPATPAPAARFGTHADLGEWKEEMRAFDAVRIELGIATPGQVQTENAAVRVPRGGGRIIHYPEHAVP
jgi:hypothetical protein